MNGQRYYCCYNERKRKKDFRADLRFSRTGRTYVVTP